jgi:hypothetical protein
VAACRDPAAPRATEVGSPAEVVLHVGQHVRVDAVLSLSFLGVTADSRCPTTVRCVWAGDGAVQIAYAVGTGPSYPDTLHTLLEPRAAQAAPYTISLLELTPYPGRTDPIPAAAYAARFKIESN